MILGTPTPELQCRRRSCVGKGIGSGSDEAVSKFAPPLHSNAIHGVIIVQENCFVV